MIRHRGASRRRRENQTPPPSKMIRRKMTDPARRLFFADRLTLGRATIAIPKAPRRFFVVPPTRSRKMMGDPGLPARINRNRRASSQVMMTS